MSAVEPEAERVLTHAGLVCRSGDDHLNGLDSVGHEAVDDDGAQIRLGPAQLDTVRPRSAAASTAVRKKRIRNVVVAGGRCIEHVLVAAESGEEQSALFVEHG